MGTSAFSPLTVLLVALVRCLLGPAGTGSTASAPRLDPMVGAAVVDGKLRKEKKERQIKQGSKNKKQ